MHVSFEKPPLAPEQLKAVDHLESMLVGYAEKVTDSLPSMEQIAVENSTYFLRGPIINSDLPRPGNWGWNQSRKREHLQSNSGIKVSFYKVVPLSRKEVIILPPLKVWVYNITKLDGELLGIIWVERASSTRSVHKRRRKTTEENQTTNETELCIDSINLADLAFLSPFISPELSFEFGWRTRK